MTSLQWIKSRSNAELLELDQLLRHAGFDGEVDERMKQVQKELRRRATERVRFMCGLDETS